MKKSELLLELLRSVEATKSEEIDCEEFLAQVAPYLERVAAGDSAASEFDRVVQHLSVCPECKEEFNALLRVYDLEPE